MAQPSQADKMQALYGSLKELGLTAHEIALYALSLTKGPSTIASLAQALGISRPNLYVVIRGLEKHGLAKYSERKKYDRHFTVEPPTTVRALIRVKRRTAEALEQQVVGAMPDLLALYRQGSTDTRVQVIEGQELFASTLDTILEEAKDEIQFFGSSTDFVGLVTWPVEHRFIEGRKRRKLKINVLTLPGTVSTQLKSDDSKELRETRVLEGWPNFPSSFILFANKAFIWQPKAAMALLITDEYIYAMLRAIFDHLWKTTAKATN